MLQLKNILMGLLLSLIISGSAMALTLEEIDALVSSMTLDEKAGQMTQAERGTANSTDVKNYFLGSILSGGGSVPATNTPAGWAAMHDDYQTKATQTRLGIPILYGIDAVHGHSNVYGATIFPHNIGLGATRDPDLVEEIGRITAKEVRCTGIEWTFAPCVAVVRDERWGRTYEGFGEHPELATMFSGRFVKGLQGTGTFMNGERIVACAKHFAGDGGTGGGDDQGNTVCTEQELRDIHMPGYVEAIANGVGTIMPSFSSWNGLKMHENEYLLTDVLKNPADMNFDGFLIGDWHAVEQASGSSFYDDIVLCVNAGLDMGMQPGNWQDWITNLKTAAGNGDIPMSRIDDAVKRILLIKNDAGLLDGVSANIYSDPTLVNGGSLGSQAHRDVAREAVRKSLVLLKNDGVLPISKGANVFVAGKNANDIGNQCGGWTISWQGSSGNITPGTTILEGIQQEVTGNVDFNEGGNGAAGHDVAIVVIGETPYAEGNGDDTDLALDSTDINCLNNVVSAGIPTVVVLVSGRPMMISDYLSDWNAFVAAWLPGTEGDGVAEVLFGDYDFTGTLPHTWPRNIQQVPINFGDSSYDPLFAYGFGLDHGTILPTINITSPANGAIVPAGNITITADASTTKPGGSITKVEFYEGLNLLGQDTTEPYSYTWNSVADGCYTIMAKVTDSDAEENTHSIDISVGTGCGGGNTPYHGTPFVLPTRIEAEDYDLGGEGIAYHDNDGGNNGNEYRSEDVDIENCSDAGGGFDVGWLSANEWMEYVVTVPVSGTYDIDIRIASQDTGGNFHLEFNGVDQTGNISVPKTNGWQNWETVSATATLSAGTQIMRFVNADSGDEYNLNYFDFTAPMVDVPNAVGVDLVIGHQAITGAGLTLGPITYSYSDTLAVNYVISQNPASGTSVILGSPVSTEISLGPETSMETVPDVVGMTQVGAQSAITGVGLTVGTVSQAFSDTVAFGDTISQSPIGGTSVASGSSVDISVSLGFRGDLDDDGSVDLVDLQIMVSEWLTVGTQADIGPIDINGDGGDGWVDFIDFSVLASDWQKSIP